MKKTFARITSSTIASILLFLIIAIVGYSYYQYTSSKHHSQLEIERQIQQNQEQPYSLEKPLDFQAEKTVKNEPIHVLLIGIDTNEGNAARTDTIMIAQYAPKNGTLKLASIMRDCYVSIPGHNKNKINASFFFGGPELLRQTIKENFDIDLHYYAMVNFDGFVHVVDTIAPKGITVNIEKNMVYKNGGVSIDFKAGKTVLDGKQALNYVRFRNDEENDFGRVRRQQEMIKLLKNELMTVRGITRIPQIIGTIEPYIQTNITTANALAYAKDFMINPVEEVETLTIPISDGYVDKHYPHAGAVLELNLEKNKQALHQFFQLTNTTK